ncbi:outer membrane lipoprotein-sorting protein [Marinitoga litoralis]|uniref:outer membrane lipoprotein-sorting protein n=1 Tax=Marinitoga litoralis TaxID=570855 RepID=UPI001960A465|nr:outer membrane lipoprotein-sorting protein [Marinitoga litoralis]MBM7559347.1 outer membrane lipoprotein-sorting protein [Marinitoga litoralis]
MKRKALLMTVVLILTSFVFAITGQEVLDNVKDEHDNFKTEKSLVIMKLKDSNGDIREREFDMYLMHSGDDSLALVRFHKPSEVKNITLLTLSDDEIYLYMPAYRKTKRISGGAKNGKFVGSDFKYNDISLLYNEQTGDYDANLIKETDKEYVVEVIPHEKDNDYGRIIMTIKKEHMLFEKIEFYNHENKLIKIMNFKDEKDFDGHILATTIELNNLEENHSTILEIKKVEFDIPITKKFFDIGNISKPVLKYK